MRDPELPHRAITPASEPLATSLAARANRLIAGLPAPLQGAFWMLTGVVVMSGMSVMIRYASETVHPFESLFFRNLFALLFLLPWMVRGGHAEIRVSKLGIYTVRGLITFVSMASWFYAVTVIPLSQMVALSFTSPLFGTLLAVLVLHEVVRARRWAATTLGFIGVLIIIRPGIDTFDVGTGLMLMSAFTTAMSVIIVKRLTRTESTTAIVAWLTLVLVPVSLLTALPVWTWPSLTALGWLAGLGICGVMGHWCVARAFAAADASLVMVFDYVRLPITAVIAYLVFDERTDAWTWVGASIIAAASIYTAHREAKLHRARIAAAAIAEQAQAAEAPPDAPGNAPGGTPAGSQRQ